MPPLIIIFVTDFLKRHRTLPLGLQQYFEQDIWYNMDGKLLGKHRHLACIKISGYRKRKKKKVDLEQCFRETALRERKMRLFLGTSYFQL